MDHPLHLDIESLWSSSLQFLQPHRPEDIQGVFDAKQKYTAPSSLGAEIYSGYATRIQERYGLKDSLLLAEKLRAEFDTLIVLGIGGSALGARTALNALEWSTPKTARKNVFIIDNLDPIFFEDSWGACKPSKTAVLIISKSGGTIETMAQASVLLERFKAEGLSIEKHFFAVTDPEKGALRSWCTSNNVKALSVPEDVGGRFSVLTPVGLLPLAFAGINIEELVQGAADFLSYKYVDQMWLAKMGLRMAELERGSFNIHALMPYSTKLKDFGAWFVQLWGESLGKSKPGVGAFGTAPLAAVGATDQHSLLQFLIDSPNKIVTGFIKVKQWPQLSARKTSMATLPAEFSGLSFAFGKSFEQILNCEATATRQVLEKLHRPTYELVLQDHGALSLGALFAFYMELTSFTAAAHGINPYDQPGVELGKKILPALLKDQN